jgi:hypothetical protein
MDLEGVRDALRRAIEKAGTASAWGAEHDISSAFISDILHGRREPGDKLLKALGLVKVSEYVGAGPLPRPLPAMTLAIAHNRAACYLDYDKATTPGERYAWLMRWGEGVRDYLADREFNVHGG